MGGRGGWPCAQRSGTTLGCYAWWHSPTTSVAGAAEGRFPCRRAFLGQPAPRRWARDVSTLPFGKVNSGGCERVLEIGGKGAEGGRVGSQLLSLEAYRQPTDSRLGPHDSRGWLNSFQDCSWPVPGKLGGKQAERGRFVCLLDKYLPSSLT